MKNIVGTKIICKSCEIRFDKEQVTNGVINVK